MATLAKAVHDRDRDLDNEDGKTRYTARVRHWTVVDREAHEKMGFYDGWGRATGQLEAVVAKL